MINNTNKSNSNKDGKDLELQTRPYQVVQSLTFKAILIAYDFPGRVVGEGEGEEHHCILGDRQWQDLHCGDVDQAHEGPAGYEQDGRVPR